MVSPPTLQRHELVKSIHATFLYPTSFLPADTRYIRIWYIIRTSLKPRLVQHTRRLFFWMQQLETRFARIIMYAAARRESMYSYIYTFHVLLLLLLCSVLLYCCCCCSCCCSSSSCDGWRNSCCGSLHLISVFYFSSFTHDLFSMYPLAVLSHLQRRFFTYYTCYISCILGNYGHARSQGGP